ncbi:MAG: hypothetical protein O7C59_08765 [Rickettsia endosymbiont of Ixodes persulcatus]|nr:hypothetical protein [Rickettsia endosymbiont of Ixodes persulcatus]
MLPIKVLLSHDLSQYSHIDLIQDIITYPNKSLLSQIDTLSPQEFVNLVDELQYEYYTLLEYVMQIYFTKHKFEIIGIIIHTKPFSSFWCEQCNIHNIIYKRFDMRLKIFIAMILKA